MIITKPTQLTYSKLCEFFNSEPITSRTKQANEDRKNQINYFRTQFNGEIKYNKKKSTYTLIPLLHKADLEKIEKLEDAREKGLTVTLHSGEEISIVPNNCISKVGFQNYIYYMAKHFWGNRKSEFYLMCLHPIAFYNRIFNNYYQYDEIDGFTYLTKSSLYNPYVLIAGRDLLFKRIGSHVDSALKALKKNGYLDIWEYYVTNLGQKLDEEQMKPFINYACKQMNCINEGMAIEKDSKTYFKLRNEAFQESLNKGKIRGFEQFKNSELYVKEKKFEIFSGGNTNFSALQMNQDQLLDILDDYCKVFYKRIEKGFNEKGIIIKQDKKDIKVGYDFEEEVRACYLDYITLDRNSFISPKQFQQQHYENRYSIYMMKAIKNKGKLNRIINYREQCRKENKTNKKGEGLK